MKKNYADGNNMPMGLGMALAQNIDAMNRFSSLDQTKQQQIIDKTHEIHSKKEMQQLAQQIADGSFN